MSLPWLSDPRRPLTSPRELPKLEAWFDALDTRTMLSGDGTTITDGGSVALWGDKSGNSGVNCLVLPGAASNYASVPDAAAVDITGDIDIQAEVALNAWSGAGVYYIVAKRNDGALRAYNLAVDNAGTISGRFSSDGGANAGEVAVSSAATGFAAYSKNWIRITRQASSGDVKFYTSSNGSTWTQLGTTQSTNAGAIYNSSVPVGIGASGSGEVINSTGLKIYRVRILNGYDGAGTAVLDIDFSLAPKKLANGDTFVCATGQTVTLNSSGATGARIAGERDLFQGTLANRPVYLAYAGTKYGWLNATAGNYLSTPDAVPVSITGDIDVRARVSLADWSPSGEQVLISKAATAGQTSYLFRVNGGGSTGTLNFLLSADGSAVSNPSSSVAVAFADGAIGWVRATWRASDGRVQFFTAPDAETPSWTQLGTDQSAAIGAIFDGTSIVELGARSTGATGALNGRIYRAQIYDGIAGTLAADFNPALYTSGTTFTASTGEVWTINGGAHIVTRTGLYGNGSTTAMQPARYSAAQPVTAIVFGEQVSWTSGDYILDGGAANAGAIIQTTSTPQVNLNATSSVAGNTGWLLKTFGMVRAVFNGASSALGVNRTAVTTGDAGATAPNGLTLWASGGLASNGNAFISEVCQYTSAIDTATGGRLALYGGRKHRYSA